MNICFILNTPVVFVDKHHVIPISSGGESGPTVTIRPDLHQGLHRCIKNPSKKSEFIDSLPTVDSKLRASMLIKAALDYKQSIKKATVTVTIELQSFVYNNYKIMAKNKKMKTSVLIGELLSSIPFK